MISISVARLFWLSHMTLGRAILVSFVLVWGSPAIVHGDVVRLRLVDDQRLLVDVINSVVEVLFALDVVIAMIILSVIPERADVSNLVLQLSKVRIVVLTVRLDLGLLTLVLNQELSALSLVAELVCWTCLFLVGGSRIQTRLLVCVFGKAIAVVVF